MQYQFNITDYKREEGLPELGPKTWMPGSSLKLLAQTNDLFLVSKENAVNLVDTDAVPVWKEALVFESVPKIAHISEDRAMILTDSSEYHAWGHLGPAILVDLKNGKIVRILRGRTAQALSGGKFLLGLEGYDIFHTWLHNRDGKLLNEWNSCGNYVIGSHDDIRVIELDRKTPTTACIVRLRMNGEIERGMSLKSCFSSPGLLLANEDLMFCNDGHLIICDKNMKKVYEMGLLTPYGGIFDSKCYASGLKMDGSRILLTLYDQGEDGSIYYKHTWTIEAQAD